MQRPLQWGWQLPAHRTAHRQLHPDRLRARLRNRPQPDRHRDASHFSRSRHNHAYVRSTNPHYSSHRRSLHQRQRQRRYQSGPDLPRRESRLLRHDRGRPEGPAHLRQRLSDAMGAFLDTDATATGGTGLIVDGVEANRATVSASAVQEVRINQDPYSAQLLLARPRPDGDHLQVRRRPLSRPSQFLLPRFGPERAERARAFQALRAAPHLRRPPHRSHLRTRPRAAFSSPSTAPKRIWTRW